MKFLLIITLNLIVSYEQTILCPAALKQKSQQNNFQISSRQLMTDTIYGFKMIVDQKDQTISKLIRQQGTWKPEMIKLIQHFVRQKHSVLNVGSQLGLQALIMGKIIGPQGKLYIMQPYSVSYKIVKKNIYLNNLQNITQILRVGAGDTQTSAQIQVDYQNTGGAQINLKSSSKITNKQIVKQQINIDLIDNILSQISNIDFMLMDVQKMQIEALLGMKNIIKKSPNIMMIVQWQYASNSYRNQAKALKLIAWLDELQFKVYQYAENLDDRCKIGQFKQIRDLKQLLALRPTDIIIVPSHIDPNHSY